VTTKKKNKHMLLVARSDYPPGEGPDWKLALNEFSREPFRSCFWRISAQPEEANVASQLH